MVFVATIHYTMKTADPPAAIQIQQTGQVASGDAEVVQLDLRIDDEKDVTVPDAETEIRCDVDDPGILPGLESGNNRDVGDYADNRQRAYRGMLTAYVKRTGAPGKVEIPIN